MMIFVTLDLLILISIKISIDNCQDSKTFTGMFDRGQIYDKDSQLSPQSSTELATLSPGHAGGQSGCCILQGWLPDLQRYARHIFAHQNCFGSFLLSYNSKVVRVKGIRYLL